MRNLSSVRSRQSRTRSRFRTWTRSSSSAATREWGGVSALDFLGTAEPSPKPLCMGAAVGRAPSAPRCDGLATGCGGAAGAATLRARSGRRRSASGRRVGLGGVSSGRFRSRLSRDCGSRPLSRAAMNRLSPTWDCPLVIRAAQRSTVDGRHNTEGRTCGPGVCLSWFSGHPGVSRPIRPIWKRGEAGEAPLSVLNADICASSCHQTSPRPRAGLSPVDSRKRRCMQIWTDYGSLQAARRGPLGPVLPLPPGPQAPSQ